MIRTAPWSSSRELGVYSQELTGPIFLHRVLLEQAPFSMAPYQVLPWLFITTMPFLYFLLLHPEAKEKNGTKQSQTTLWPIGDHGLLSGKLQKSPFIRKSLRDPSKFLTKE